MRKTLLAAALAFCLSPFALADGTMTTGNDKTAPTPTPQGLQSSESVQSAETESSEPDAAYSAISEFVAQQIAAYFALVT